MLANFDGAGSVNGRAASYSNGKASHRASSPLTSNGTHRSSSPKNGSSKPRLPDSYFGHDREEVTRLLMQALSDMGYHTAAQNVSEASGFELESSTVASFRAAILGGDWDRAEELLDGAFLSDARNHDDSNGLILSDGADRSIMKFWIRQQKYLELLEQLEHSRALAVLRTELATIHQNPQKLQFLSGLMMCESVNEVRTKANWDGANGKSRQVLLSELSKSISPSVMLPANRLAILLHQVKESQIDACYYHTSGKAPSLYSDHTCRKANFPTENVLELDDHAGEVWQVAFSHDGTRLASCGDDKTVIIWEVPTFRMLHSLKDHNDGVGNVAWSWDDSLLVSCCRDHYARLYDMKTGRCLRELPRFGEPVTSAVWVPDDQSFITSCLDKNNSLVQWGRSGDKVHCWKGPDRVEELVISPDGRWLVAKDCEKQIHVYNFRTREFMYKMDLKVQLSSLSISQDSRHLLVNQANGCAHLVDLVRRSLVQQYSGHSGGRFVIRASLGGADESFVISGSEDGYIYIWHKTTAQLIERLVAHSPRCNSVAWCPTDACLFASCGDDGKVKIWSNDDWRTDAETAQRYQTRRQDI